MNELEANYEIYETVISNNKGTKVSREFKKIPVKINTSFKMVATDYWRAMLARGSLKKDVLLHYLFAHSQWQTNVVRVTPDDRKTIYRELFIDERHLVRLLADLKKDNAIRGSHGKYMINPALMFNGSMNTWAKVISENYYKTDYFFNSNQQLYKVVKQIRKRSED